MPTKLLLDLRREVSTAACLIVAVALAAAYPVLAYRVHPLALPVALAAIVVATLSVSKPEVGIAVAIFLAALNPGLAGGRPWLPGAAASGLVFLVVVLRKSRTDGRPTLPPLALVALAYLTMSLLGAAMAAEPAMAVPVLRSTVTGMMLFVAIAWFVRSPRQVFWLLGGIAAGAALISTYAVWQHVSGAFVTSGFFSSSGELVARADGGFGGANQLGGFLVILVPLAVAGVVLVRRLRPFYLITAVMAVIGIYASFSRGAWLGLAVIPLVFLRGRLVVVALPVLALAALLAVPDLVRERLGTSSDQGSELAVRIDMWTTAGAVWREHPILGAGLGSFPDEYAKARVPGKQFLPGTLFEPPPHAHNMFLQSLAEQGLLGLSALVAVLSTAVWQCLRLRRSAQQWLATVGSAILASIAAFSVHNLFDVTLREGTGIYVWALLGLLSALVSIDRAEPTVRP